MFGSLPRERRDPQDLWMVELVRSTLDGDGTGPWDLWLDGIWCYARPPGHHVREQGWKLHLAATRSSATTVLHRAVEAIARHRCAFKFASSLEQVSLLNSRHYPRGGAGKFITVYPDDDQQFAALAAELDKATDGLARPSILSDRPYRPGSLVHYRYGAFRGKVQLSNDGDYRTMLARPDGSLVEDRRDAWFSAPGWAAPPLPGPETAPTPDPSARSAGAPVTGSQVRRVLLGDRFVVGQAIRHANKGGVFRYGAWLALLAASCEPALWARCVAVSPFLSGPRLHRDGAEAARGLLERLGGCQELHDAIGPRDVLRLVGAMRTRLLLIHGEADQVIPVSHARDLRARLAELGRHEGTDFEYLEIAGGGHDLPTASRALAERLARFLRPSQPAGAQACWIEPREEVTTQ